MPETIASCCKDPSLPRTFAGAISAIYAGAITDAMPIATPPMTRKIESTKSESASPEPIALITKRSAAIRIGCKRP